MKAADKETQRITMIVPIIRRSDLDSAAFRAYWRAVHGPVAARLPRVDFYEQWHLGTEPTIFGQSGEYTGEVIDGLAVLSFLSEADLAEYRTIATIMQEDEPNAFRFAARYDVPVRDDGLHKLSRESATDPHRRKGWAIFLRRSPHASINSFEHEVVKAADEMRSMLGVSNVSIALPMPRDEDRPATEAVDRYTPFERQIQGILRVFLNEATSGIHVQAALESKPSIGSGQIYNIDESPLFVFEGAMTVSALRGEHASDLITTFGAINQLDAKLLDLFVRPHRSANPQIP